MMSRGYIVTWKIYVPANNPKEAARIAQRIQKSPGQPSNFFMVVNEEDGTITDVDLDA